MNYNIDSKGTTPAYLQLYHYLVQDIVNGVYPYGTKLPSKRMIASETGLSLITVEHSLGLLSDEGYVESRQRSGSYVIYSKDDFQSSLPNVSIDAPVLSTESSHHKGDFPYSVLAKTIRRVLTEYEDRILVKSPNDGCQELRDEICHYLSRSRGMTIHPSQVIIGSGAEYFYGLIAQLYRDRRVFGLEDPSYSKIHKVYSSMGIECRMLKMTDSGISKQNLEQTDATLLHVTPFNSYPSGISIPISKKLEYLRWAKNKNGVLIEDNYDSELTVSRKQEESLFSMASEEKVIYLNTFSKTIAPSIRIGYMLLPMSLTGLFHERLGFYSCTVPVLDQYVLAELIRSGDYERHINRIRRQRRKQ